MNNNKTIVRQMPASIYKTHMFWEVEITFKTLFPHVAKGV